MVTVKVRVINLPQEVSVYEVGYRALPGLIGIGPVGGQWQPRTEEHILELSPDQTEGWMYGGAKTADGKWVIPPFPYAFPDRWYIRVSLPTSGTYIYDWETNEFHKTSFPIYPFIIVGLLGTAILVARKRR